jgi:hypothetical protein
MAEDLRFRYELTAEESRRWQQGGLEAQRLQHQLAEMQRQGGFTLAPFLDVVHPDGILAAQFAAPGADGVADAQQALPSASTASPAVRAPAEGTLTSRVTGYHMSAEESADWKQGGTSTQAVRATIGAHLDGATGGRGVPVYLDDGRWAYTHGPKVWQTVQAEVGTMLPVATVRDQMRALGERFAALREGMDVSLHVSIGRGTQTPMQESLKALEQRVEQLAKGLAPPTKDQGISY